MIQSRKKLNNQSKRKCRCAAYCQYTSNQETRCHRYPLGLLALLFSDNTNQLCPEGSVRNETFLASNNRKIFVTFIKSAWVLREAEKMEPWLNFQEHLPKAHYRTKPRRALCLCPYWEVPIKTGGHQYSCWL